VATLAVWQNYALAAVAVTGIVALARVIIVFRILHRAKPDQVPDILRSLPSAFWGLARLGKSTSPNDGRRQLPPQNGSRPLPPGK